LSKISPRPLGGFGETTISVYVIFFHTAFAADDDHIYPALLPHYFNAFIYLKSKSQRRQERQNKIFLDALVSCRKPYLLFVNKRFPNLSTRA
jgi:hypothetical protein